METKPGPRPDFDYDVFLSHKSEHKPWVEWLARSLETCGRRVFLDTWNLVPGSNWVEGLHRGVESSRAAVLVATPEVVHSGWVRQE
ncbi:MAG: toll/interleukin-1 receptor domain-containing protein, partial [bacterium]